MRIVCSECEMYFSISLVSAERFPVALCPSCRRSQDHVEAREIPAPRLFGIEKEMGRWFGGIIPRWSEQGRHTIDRSK